MMSIADGLSKVVPQQLIKTVASNGTPERVSPVPRKFRTATFVGNKAARTANTGTVYLGWSSVNDEQFIPVTTGASVTINAPSGEAYDLFDLWIDCATNADGVCVFFA